MMWLRCRGALNRRLELGQTVVDVSFLKVVSYGEEKSKSLDKPWFELFACLGVQ